MSGLKPMPKLSRSLYCNEKNLIKLLVKNLFIIGILNTISNQIFCCLLRLIRQIICGDTPIMTFVSVQLLLICYPPVQIH